MGTGSTTGSARCRIRARVEGTVQGVGFRPYVYRIVGDLALGGFVLNDERGVLLEVEGDEGSVESFLERLPAEAPPLAEIERLLHERVEPMGETTFKILESASGGEPAALVSPDTATCAECLTELFDPGDRRYRYPFINCTNCGPRFTIVRGVPYDRSLTTMAAFEMCPACRAEYEDPADRRYHAQPNACPVCGPSVRLVEREDASPGSEESIRRAAAALLEGRIVAVKGLGGFHLACRADDEAVVAQLRSRKHREDRPFALMVPDLETARTLVDLTEAEEVLLVDRARPIVLSRRKAEAAVARSVAPLSPELGLMLPYSPLHHLLLGDAGTPLVMTSGNVSDEPIAYRDEDALRRLGAIADLFLLHDRPIHMRTDDSVMRSVAVGDDARPLPIRRSRGYVPRSLDLPVQVERPILGVGAELKNAFCVAKDRRAWVGHHVGDLKNWETLRSFEEGVEHFQRLFAVEPQVVAHDLHPDYLSTKHAVEREGVRLVGVQHHHAHLAACLAEHGEEGPALGVIYDGAGYGPDGSVWGGELLLGDLEGFSRVGHLRPVRLPGGDQAVRQSWRMACAWLVESGDEDPRLPKDLIGRVEPGRWRAVATLARTGMSAPWTTSVGRLFDAVSALCGIRPEVNYEGQAAIELEAGSDRSEEDGYPLPVEEEGGVFVLDARPTVRAVLDDRVRDVAVAAIGARFHNALAGATVEACRRAARTCDIGIVVLSGGVFQNRLLLERTGAALERGGFRVLTPEKLPPNDGGIAFGQIAVAARRTANAGKEG